MSGAPFPRALVTGGTGFVGRHLVGALHGLGVRLAVLARRPPDPPLPPGVEFLPADLADAGGVSDAVRSFRPAAVFHLGGRASPREVEVDPGGGFEANALGTLHVLEAAARHARGARLLLASSAHVYARAPGARKETDPIAPVDLYGRTKAAAETLAEAFARREGLDVRVVRLFNLVGPGQSAEYALASFAEQVAAIEAGAAPPRLAVGNLEVRRDFLDVRDATRAFSSLAAVPPGPFPLFNLGSGLPLRVGALLEALLAGARIRPALVLDAARVRRGEPEEIFASIERLRTAIGFAPSIPIERSAADALAFARARLGPSEPVP